MPSSSSAAVLVLADGSVHRGQAFGALGTTTGEICFNTGMTGYQEVFTDPSYFGQILIMNAAHIGNYGVKELDVESDSIKISGLIGRNLEALYSRRQAVASLQDYLQQSGVVSIQGVDTRSLVAYSFLTRDIADAGQCFYKMLFQHSGRLVVIPVCSSPTATGTSGNFRNKARGSSPTSRAVAVDDTRA